MNKKELKVRLQIAEGEMKCCINDEYGCFDEIAQRIFMLVLSCDEMLDKSSEDILVQLDKSVQIESILNTQEYIDGIYLSQTINEAHFTASSLDGSELFVYDIEEVEREYILKVVKELIRMCDL